MRAYKFLNEQFGLKSLYERRLKLASLGDVNDPFEMIPYKIPDRKTFDDVRKNQIQEFARRGMLCFSRTYEEPVLWSHYADGHKGLCLGFDLPDDANIVTTIEYVPERLELPKDFDSITSFQKKYCFWEYEQEVRMWATCEHGEAGLAFFDFGDNLRLVQIFIGALCGLSIREVGRSVAGLPGISIRKMCLSHDSYKIMVDESVS